MNHTLLWLLLFVVAVIVGPFATLRAVSQWRARKPGDAAPERSASDHPPPKDRD